MTPLWRVALTPSTIRVKSQRLSLFSEPPETNSNICSRFYWHKHKQPKRKLAMQNYTDKTTCSFSCSSIWKDLSIWCQRYESFEAENSSFLTGFLWSERSVYWCQEFKTSEGWKLTILSWILNGRATSDLFIGCQDFIVSGGWKHFLLLLLNWILIDGTLYLVSGIEDFWRLKAFSFKLNFD